MKKRLFSAAVLVLFCGHLVACTGKNNPPEVIISKEGTGSNKEIVSEDITIDQALDRETLIDYYGEKITLKELGGDGGCYEFADLNGNGSDDFVIKSGDGIYYIISLVEARVLYECTYYEKVCIDNDFVGVIYMRPGAAPLHEDYIMFTFTEDYELEQKNSWSRYDINEDEQYTDEDEYYVNDETVSYEEYETYKSQFDNLLEMDYVINSL